MTLSRQRFSCSCRADHPHTTEEEVETNRLLFKMGFEPTASWSRVRCLNHQATQLLSSISLIRMWWQNCPLLPAFHLISVSHLFLNDTRRLCGHLCISNKWRPTSFREEQQLLSDRSVFENATKSADCSFKTVCGVMWLRTRAILTKKTEERGEGTACRFANNVCSTIVATLASYRLVQVISLLCVNLFICSRSPELRAVCVRL